MDLQIKTKKMFTLPVAKIFEEDLGYNKTLNLQGVNFLSEKKD